MPTGIPGILYLGVGIQTLSTKLGLLYDFVGQDRYVRSLSPTPRSAGVGVGGGREQNGTVPSFSCRFLTSDARDKTVLLRMRTTPGPC